MPTPPSKLRRVSPIGQTQPAASCHSNLGNQLWGQPLSCTELQGRGKEWSRGRQAQDQPTKPVEGRLLTGHHLKGKARQRGGLNLRRRGGQLKRGGGSQCLRLAPTFPCSLRITFQGAAPGQWARMVVLEFETALLPVLSDRTGWSQKIGRFRIQQSSCQPVNYSYLCGVPVSHAFKR